MDFAIKHTDNGLISVILADFPIRNLIGDFGNLKAGETISHHTAICLNKVGEVRVGSVDFVIAVKSVCGAELFGEVETTIALIYNNSHFRFLSFVLSVFIIADGVGGVKYFF